ncbi:MAG: hypothetical protein NC311_07575 [Muribaculaceae bacterium]|nr:hypothetical protein [Muribaculaceae bacterium]
MQSSPLARRLVSAIRHIDKAINTLSKTREKMPTDSPDFVLASNVLASLREARNDAVIAARRNGVGFDSNENPIE